MPGSSANSGMGTCWVGVDRIATLEPAWHQKLSKPVMIPRFQFGCSEYYFEGWGAEAAELERLGEATRASPLEGIYYCYYCC
ncbi:MAG: hypothetical protein VXX24_00145, partial [Pseudomonadota bacterium]|nr:hypothetical protein [Pseudomonadota bacterium]